MRETGGEARGGRGKDGCGGENMGMKHGQWRVREESQAERVESF